MTALEIVGLVGVVASVVGIPLAYILAKRGRQRPDLRYAVDFDVLVDPDDGLLNEGLSLSFGSTNINRVSRTYIAVWNERGDPISGEDIVPKDPLRIQLASDDAVLQARIVFLSRPQAGITYSLDDNQPDWVLTRFDFLDQGDGFILEVLHHGTISPKLGGTVRGANIRDVSSPFTTLTPSSLSWMRDSSRIRRMRHRFKKHGEDGRPTGRSPFAFLLTLALLSSFLLIGFGVIFWTFSQREGALVDPMKYDLRTLEGQAKFASKVQQEQPLAEVSGLAIAFPIIGLMMIILVALMFLLIGRRVVPRSIVREEVERPAVEELVEKDAALDDTIEAATEPESS